MLATPLHEPAADNVPATNAPPGSLKLADDGSFAALLPARRAMTWQSLDPSSNAVVRERYWITFQPGEIRTCKVCHGINTLDQAGQLPPENKPEALRELLRYWKTQNTPTVGVWTNGNTNYLAVTFNRRPAVTNVTQTVEISDDLINWLGGSTYTGTNATPDTLYTTEISRSGSPVETLKVRDNQAIGAATNRFMRVKVTSP